MRCKEYFKYIFIFMSVLCMTACTSHKKVVNGTDNVNTPAPTKTKNATNADFVAKIQSNRSTAKNLTAKIKCTVAMTGKSITTSGMLKMRRDEVIQISLVDPIIGITEVGRLEFSPENVLIIDRINKRYVDVKYSEWAMLKNANVDFNSLQSLFWNELFQPGQKEIDTEAFTFANAGADSLNITFKSPLLKYNFKTSKQNAVLGKTTIVPNASSNYRLDCDYSDFTQYQTAQFPKDIFLSFLNGKQTMSLGFKLSNIKDASDWEPHTNVSGKYTKTDADRLFRSLIGN